MPDDQPGTRYDGPGRFIPAFVGALTAGKRKGDGLLKLGAGAFLAWRLIVYIEDRDRADIAQRQVQHKEILETMKAQVTALDRLEEATRESTGKLDLMGAIVIERWRPAVQVRQVEVKVAPRAK